MGRNDVNTRPPACVIRHGKIIGSHIIAPPCNIGVSAAKLCNSGRADGRRRIWESYRGDLHLSQKPRIQRGSGLLFTTRSENAAHRSNEGATNLHLSMMQAARDLKKDSTAYACVCVYNEDSVDDRKNEFRDRRESGGIRQVPGAIIFIF